MEALSVLMRWLHLASVAVVVGGVVYARFVAAPAADEGARFRPLALTAIAALLVSGVYNLLTAPGHSARYHMILGIKLLLALHVVSMVFLITAHDATPGRIARRPRLLLGTAISGLAIILISAYLRRIF